MKNRMPEIGASGTVRGEGGNILTYSETPAIRTYQRTRGLWPAFESRQGTKARGLGTRCGARYGDFGGSAGAGQPL